jgi:hypothetical protein
MKSRARENEVPPADTAQRQTFTLEQSRERLSRGLELIEAPQVLVNY